MDSGDSSLVVADPGVPCPVEGRGGLLKQLFVAKFPEKLHEIKEIWGSGRPL